MRPDRIGTDYPFRQSVVHRVIGIRLDEKRRPEKFYRRIVLLQDHKSNNEKITVHAVHKEDYRRIQVTSALKIVRAAFGVIDLLSLTAADCNKQIMDIH